MDIIRTLHNTRTRLAAVERQIAPSASTDIATSLVDGQSFGIDKHQVHSATFPPGLNQSTDVGTEWVNTSTGDVEWWDGVGWNAGSYPYFNNGYIDMLAPYALANGNAVILISTQSSAPTTHNKGDVWFSTTTSIWAQWHGTSWVTIFDPILLAMLDGLPTTNNVLITFFLQTATPSSSTIDDFWIDPVTWSLSTLDDGGWNLVPPTDVSVTETASTFQTALVGLRAVLTKTRLAFFNGYNGSTPATITASNPAGYPRLTLGTGLGTAGIGMNVKVTLDAVGKITLEPQSGTVDINGNTTIQDGLAVTNLPFLNATALNVSGSVFTKATSSKRYKTDIEDAELDWKTALKMTPVFFKYKAELTVKGHEDDVHLGFIAEQADELGLKQFVVYDDEGRPDSFRYDLYAIALQQAVLQLISRVEALENTKEG